MLRLSVEYIAGYCAGDSLSDASIETQLRQLEEQDCFELDSEGNDLEETAVKMKMITG